MFALPYGGHSDRFEIEIVVGWEAALAKVYGGRWEHVDAPPLGRGGQGTVFRVKDLSGAYQG
jgi:hypothetical protein